MLLGYHYALMKLSGKAEYNYPGPVLIDFPMTLADGTSIANNENYLMDPFVALATTNAATQTIICGRAFKGLQGANRIRLNEVWTHTPGRRASRDPNRTVRYEASAPWPIACASCCTDRTRSRTP